MAAEIRSAGADFSVVARKILFSARPYNAGYTQVNMETAPGDREFLAARRESPITRAIVTLNWFEELKTKVRR